MPNGYTPKNQFEQFVVDEFYQFRSWRESFATECDERRIRADNMKTQITVLEGKQEVLDSQQKGLKDDHRNAVKGLLGLSLGFVIVALKMAWSTILAMFEKN